MKKLKLNEENQLAVDEERKTQTRRAFEIVIDEDSGYVFFEDVMLDIHNWKELIIKYCPYGKIGDINNGLKITNIRVEQLCEISIDDCWSEGMQTTVRAIRSEKGSFTQTESVKYLFKKLWQSIYPDHPKKAWELNPWVWVIEFEQVNN